jgi:vacuolar-type H+-ATPase subunit H
VDLEGELEGLKDTVMRGGPAMLNHRVWLDLEEFESKIDQIIALLPKEVRRARRICKEEQRIVQDAKDEARRLLDEARAEADNVLKEAREEAEKLVESSAIRQKALEQSEAMIAQAQERSREIREMSYTYSQQVVDNVIGSLKRLTQTVEQDRIQLDQMRPEREPQKPDG